jgi:hypothetical protein
MEQPAPNRAEAAFRKPTSLEFKPEDYPQIRGRLSAVELQQPHLSSVIHEKDASVAFTAADYFFNTMHGSPNICVPSRTEEFFALELDHLEKAKSVFPLTSTGIHAHKGRYRGGSLQFKPTPRRKCIHDASLCMRRRIYLSRPQSLSPECWPRSSAEIRRTLGLLG